MSKTRKTETNSLRRFICIILLFACGISTEVLADWKQFTHSDHHLSLAFPRHIFDPSSASTEGNSLVFYTSDRSGELTVASVEREPNESPGQVLRRLANEEAAHFTYMRSTDRFFVASGYWQNLIFYRRCNFAVGQTRAPCFELRYPAVEKRKWDPVVIRLSRSLRVSENR